MRPLHIQTPLYHSLPLSKKVGKTIYLKMESAQIPGSYKIRGIGRLCQYYAAKGKNHFVSASGGNAGIATAYAGKSLGIPVDVFVPKTSSAIFLDWIKAYGAKVHVHGEVWDEANDAARTFVETVSGAYIPPFDHELIWAGHATMIDEVANEGVRPHAVVVAVGGGGLASGVLQGMQQNGWDDVPLLTAETEGAQSFAKSYAAGKVITLDRIDTIATSLGAKRITPNLFAWTKKHPIKPFVFSDTQAMKAVASFLDDHRVLVEASSGTALALLYENIAELQNYPSILVIVCGGVGISLNLLQNYFKNLNL